VCRRQKVIFSFKCNGKCDSCSQKINTLAIAGCLILVSHKMQANENNENANRFYSCLLKIKMAQCSHDSRYCGIPKICKVEPESLTHPFGLVWGGALSSSAAGGEAAKMWP